MRKLFQNLSRRKSATALLADYERDGNIHGTDLVRTLRLKDLVSFGIAAIIGAGIFSTIGNASAAGGPGVSLLFIFTAIACGFSALCYAQFASTIPVSGSAYTYAYASFGELVAWIIGWDLLMEYAIGNIAVAISWSDYFTAVLQGVGLGIPEYLTMDFLSASRGYDAALKLLAQGQTMSQLPGNMQEAFLAWQQAPSIGGIKLVADVPALGITVLITYLVYIGIKESKRTANFLVLLKLLVILLVITVGALYVSPTNWTPFAPNGLAGIMKGVSAVFFAYIGFDAISTTAEECENPQRDLPRAMIFALVICTVLYVILALILTGMVPFQELAVGDPLAYVFSRVNLDVIAGIVAVSAIVAMASVLLVFQYGQPRIWMTMSRDGLLPGIFSRIHPKYRTPSFATLVTGFVVAVPALFMNLTEVTDLTSIGTLFAFVLVCGGILLLEEKQKVATAAHKGFRVPYINGKYTLPLLVLLGAVLLFVYNRPELSAFFSLEGGWGAIQHKLPMLGFLLVTTVLTVLTVTRNLSLIPVLGLLTNLYLMTELGITNWSRFLAWLMLGLIIYFAYGYRNSKLHKPEATATIHAP
ncbi:amino acid/polyamine/organocation transporter (APC superfamily) [Pontibacter ummariensis]|uniref:Amino acid/polyamine/organocation transporter, APC superfamily n=1 Tax=Pontibacter ummariensis TaxID=1610492 RepID=A0A239C2R7_9BACT|nr:amino acid permease [Pontibacter ummariensis]PRY15481.1 amino acid/polyamine/organocation transporter (APC superfamily) [Pontibacter ummariensis]SNS14466.1 amino acid/polyamine/organocation transporter, APC superfamily [Pontibacter ummariensis]